MQFVPLAAIMLVQSQGQNLTDAMASVLGVPA